MRNFVFILGVFAALVCFEKPAVARCCEPAIRGPSLPEIVIGTPHLVLRTMFGRRQRAWRELRAQSHVPVGAKSISVDEVPQALLMRSADAFLSVPFVTYLCSRARVA